MYYHLLSKNKHSQEAKIQSIIKQSILRKHYLHFTKNQPILKNLNSFFA